MNKIIDLIKNNKKIVVAALAIILVISIIISVVSYILSGRSPVMPQEGARVIIDCGIRVGFVVDKNFVVEEVFACEKKYEKYIRDITYEDVFANAVIEVFNYAMDERYLYNVDYYAVFVSVESKNPEMYSGIYTQINDIVMEDGMGMDHIGYCSVAITEYDSKIQRTANRFNVPYGLAYACLELETANESLSASKLMKEEFYIISQLANNANGKNKNYCWTFLDEISRRNLNSLAKK